MDPGVCVNDGELEVELEPEEPVVWLKSSVDVDAD